MIAGFGRAALVPTVPFDPQGYAARDQSITDLDPALSVTACVIKGLSGSLVILSADVLGHTGEFPKLARDRIAAEIGCSPSDVLLAATHTHASLWPGTTRKVSGPDPNVWLPGEREYLDLLPDVYVSAARSALESARDVNVTWGYGSATGLGVNRRERTDQGVIIGWNPDGDSDDTVTAIRFDEPSGAPVGLIVSFACHPVVNGASVRRASTDFVGPLRETVEAVRGGLCLFLQGTSGDIQPLDALNDEPGKEKLFGQRIALEALHAVADTDRRSQSYRRTLVGRWAPTATYRRRPSSVTESQAMGVAFRTLDLPLEKPLSLETLVEELKRRTAELAAALSGGAPGSVVNGTTNQIKWLQHWLTRTQHADVPGFATVEIWAARIGDGVIVGISAEPFAAIGKTVRAASPAAATLVAGCCGSVAGYIPTASEFDAGGFEVTMSHRVYGLPSALGRDSAVRVQVATAQLLDELFPISFES